MKLLNSAMMPQPGIYLNKRISKEVFIEHVRRGTESFVGYPDTAKFIEDLTGCEIPINREQTFLDAQDEMLIIKLKYRVQSPQEKGKFTPGIDDYEFFYCLYSAD